MSATGWESRQQTKLPLCNVCFGGREGEAVVDGWRQAALAVSKGGSFKLQRWVKSNVPATTGHLFVFCLSGQTDLVHTAEGNVEQDVDGRPTVWSLCARGDNVSDVGKHQMAGGRDLEPRAADATRKKGGEWWKKG